MFYLTSRRADLEDTVVELPSLDSSAKLALAEVSVRRVGEEWLLLCPASGAWCFVTDREMEICRRLANISFNDLQRQVAQPAELLRLLLKHLYVRGLLAIYRNEMEHRLDWSAVPVSAPRSFMLTFLLSSRCNLACRYCYLGLEAKTGEIRHLPRELGWRILEYAFQRPGETLSVDFGEIATSFTLFRDLVHDFRCLQDTYSKEACLAIQTNGTTLNSGLIEFLKQNNIAVGISLDGPAHLNDQVRVFPDGVGSYKQTVKALREVLSRGMPHIVTCTVSQANYRCAAEILEHFLDLGISHYYFKPIMRRGTAKTTWANLGIGAEDYCQLLDDVVDHVVASRNLDALDESLLRCLFRALGDDRGWDSRCSSGYCNCGQDILVVSAQGKLYPCPRFVCDDFELFCLGKESESSHRFLSQVDARFHSPPNVCHSCLWQSLCHGGCALSAWYFGGKSDASDPDCLIHQHIYSLVFERLIPVLRRTNHVSSKLGRIRVIDETFSPERCGS